MKRTAGRRKWRISDITCKTLCDRNCVHIFNIKSDALENNILIIEKELVYVHFSYCRFYIIWNDWRTWFLLSKKKKS